MRKTGITVFVLILLVSGLAPMKAQTRNEKKDAAFKQMTEIIQSGSYQFKVQSVNPTGGKTINPSSVYTMTAKEGIMKAYLPYFGRAYQASYGGDGGVEFEGEPENLEITTNEKKRTISLSFQISGNNDSYSATLAVSHGGYGNLTIISPKRQAISYYGPVSSLE